MNELFNFHDSWIVVEQNWWLVLLSLALGIWVVGSPVFAALDHNHFRMKHPKVINVIVDSMLARDRTVNRYPLNLITR